MEIKPDRTPFILGKEKELENGCEGFHTISLKLAQKDPSLLVKQLALRVEGKRVDTYSEEEFREHYQNALEYMQKYFGKYLPKAQLVYGENEEGNKTGYLIMEDVAIENIKNYSDEQYERLLIKMDEMLTDVINDWHSCNPKDGRRALIDIFLPGNVLYGTTKRNPNPQLYLVDIYPILLSNGKELKKSMDSIFEMYKDVFDFPAATKALEEALKDSDN